jgi:hypothetical protein
MDLLNKAEKIAMTNLLILENPMSLAICAPPPTIDPKQKGLGALQEKLQEVDTCVPIRKKKNRKKHY